MIIRMRIMEISREIGLTSGKSTPLYQLLFLCFFTAVDLQAVIKKNKAIFLLKDLIMKSEFGFDLLIFLINNTI
jgi:hypothetical protein